MERWTVLIGGAVAVTVAAGTFAVVRAVATDEQVAPPPTAVATSTTVTPASTTTTAPVAPAGSPAATASSGAVETVEIEMSGFAFSPAEITVARGTTVTWVNRDGVDHSIISEDGSVLSPAMGDGESFSFTFTAAGVYPYICGFHPEMTGTIVVEE